MAVVCKKCGGAHPPWECTASKARIAAYQNRGAVSAVTPDQIRPTTRGQGPEEFRAQDKRQSEGEPRTKPKPVGQAGSPANPEAKATKANPRDDAPMASEADGVASRLSAGRTAQGAPVTAVSAAKQKGKDTRKGDRHRAGYWKTYQRKDRAKAKETDRG